MSHAIHRDGKYWIAPFAPGFDARHGGRQRGPSPAGAARPCAPSTATALRSSPDILGLISWNEFSENTHVEPSVRYRHQSLDALRQLRSAGVPAPAGPAAPSDDGSSRPGSTASTGVYAGNLLRLAGSPSRWYGQSGSSPTCGGGPVPTPLARRRPGTGTDITTKRTKPRRAP